jgi:hypothetical protein
LCARREHLVKQWAGLRRVPVSPRNGMQQFGRANRRLSNLQQFSASFLVFPDDRE